MDELAVHIQITDGIGVLTGYRIFAVTSKANGELLCSGFDRTDEQCVEAIYRWGAAMGYTHVTDVGVMNECRN